MPDIVAQTILKNTITSIVLSYTMGNFRGHYPGLDSIWVSDHPQPTLPDASPKPPPCSFEPAPSSQGTAGPCCCSTRPMIHWMRAPGRSVRQTLKHCHPETQYIRASAWSAWRSVSWSTSAGAHPALVANRGTRADLALGLDPGTAGTQTRHETPHRLHHLLQH